jgi:predicted esterase
MSEPDLGYIHRFVPGGTGRISPTLLLLHSTGGNEDQLLGLGRSLVPEAALISPRGKVLEYGNPRFFRRLAEGVFDEEDLVLRTHELADFVGAASDAYGLDRRGVIAVGYSNGANIAASMLLLRPQVLAGAVLFHPMVPLVPDEMPNLSKRPVFIGAGELDPMAPREQTEKLASMLRNAGATVTLHWRPGGHMLTPDETRAAQEWLHKAGVISGVTPASRPAGTSSPESS